MVNAAPSADFQLHGLKKHSHSSRSISSLLCVEVEASKLVPEFPITSPKSHFEAPLSNHPERTISAAHQQAHHLLKHLVKMQPTFRLLHACRITLFTRANCSLCTNAKKTLSDVWDTRPFDYKEIDVMAPEGKSWRDLYEFDTPVVGMTI